MGYQTYEKPVDEHSIAAVQTNVTEHCSRQTLP
jgi:hypothetical protein